MFGHTTLTMLMTRYYRYVPNLIRRDGTLFDRQLQRRGVGKTVSVTSAAQLRKAGGVT
jgi:hypothetical protein